MYRNATVGQRHDTGRLLRPFASPSLGPQGLTCQNKQSCFANKFVFRTVYVSDMSNLHVCITASLASFLLATDMMLHGSVLPSSVPADQRSAHLVLHSTKDCRSVDTESLPPESDAIPSPGMSLCITPLDFRKSLTRKLLVSHNTLWHINALNTTGMKINAAGRPRGWSVHYHHQSTQAPSPASCFVSTLHCTSHPTPSTHPTAIMEPPPRPQQRHFGAPGSNAAPTGSAASSSSAVDPSSNSATSASGTKRSADTSGFAKIEGARATLAWQNAAKNAHEEAVEKWTRSARLTETGVGAKEFEQFPWNRPESSVLPDLNKGWTQRELFNSKIERMWSRSIPKDWPGEDALPSAVFSTNPATPTHIIVKVSSSSNDNTDARDSGRLLSCRLFFGTAEFLFHSPCRCLSFSRSHQPPSSVRAEPSSESSTKPQFHSFDHCRSKSTIVLCAISV